MSQESLMKCLSKHCCGKCCIQSLSSDPLNLRPAYEIVQALREELIGLSKFDREQFIRAKITGISCVCVSVCVYVLYVRMYV